MGTYVGLKIGNFDFLSSKNSLGELLLPFSEKDLKVEESFDDDGEKYTKRYFSTTVREIKEILDVVGCTIDAAKTDFENLKNDKLEFIQYCLEDGNGNTFGLSYDDINENFTFDNWYRAVIRYAKILSTAKYNYKKHCYQKLENQRKKVLTVSDTIVLDSLPFGRGYWGFEDIDFNVWNIFRVILEAFPTNKTVTLDYTELYESGWCDEHPEKQDYNIPKTLILTEGKFDTEVISKSIDLLYPHMSKVFSFMNFSEYKVQGSTNFLTHYLKAFFASGIQNRVIALYDNDSAGLAELIDLKKMNIPDNFRVLHLPDIKLAESYPTIGPNGEEMMNINGKACSIELFLGKDVLTEKQELIPVHWNGYIEKTKTYQGEVTQKSLIQKKFFAKCSDAKRNPSSLRYTSKWLEMDILLKNIFNAFNVR